MLCWVCEAQVTNFVYALCFPSGKIEICMKGPMEESKLIYVLFFLQLDADREEEEVFCDISMALDNKLFPSKEPAAGEMELSFVSTALITLMILLI